MVNLYSIELEIVETPSKEDFAVAVTESEAREVLKRFEADVIQKLIPTESCIGAEPERVAECDPNAQPEELGSFCIVLYVVRGTNTDDVPEEFEELPVFVRHFDAVADIGGVPSSEPVDPLFLIT